MAQLISKEVCKEYIYRYIYIHIMDSGNSSNDTQCISRPFTPKKGHHNARGAFGRFEKTSEIKKTTRELLSKGYKIWSANTELRRQL